MMPGSIMENADTVFLHLAGRIRHQLVAVVQRDTETRIRQHLVDDALHLDQFFLGHAFSPSRRWDQWGLRAAGRRCGTRGIH